MKLLKKIAILTLSALPLSAQAKDTGVKGYEIYDGQYISTLLIGDITHDYIGKPGFYDLVSFPNEQNGRRLFYITIDILDSGSTQFYFTFETPDALNLIDWEASNLIKPGGTGPLYYLFFEEPNIPVYFKRPLKATGIVTNTKKYLATTSPAQSFAGSYDGFIPAFYYTSISGNKSFFDSITSLSSLPTGKAWQSGDVSGYGIKINNFIIQNYYVVADILESEKEYVVNLLAYAKSDDGQKSVDIIIQPRLGFVNLQSGITEAKTYNFPQPVPTLETTLGYYNIIRSSGAYGLTESIKNYEEGYKDGQGNPTFKSFIVSAFEACAAFFSLPVLGEHITIGALIGAFVGLGALFLLIRLFR